MVQFREGPDYTWCSLERVQITEGSVYRGFRIQMVQFREGPDYRGFGLQRFQNTDGSV